MKIRNVNNELGMMVEFEGETVEQAVTEMLKAVQNCSPEMAQITELIEGEDYEIVEEEDND